MTLGVGEKAKVWIVSINVLLGKLRSRADVCTGLCSGTSGEALVLKVSGILHSITSVHLPLSPQPSSVFLG